MNLNIIKIKVIVLILVIESHGGLIDGVYGRIKNTTIGLEQDVKNVWTYSKGLVRHDETASEEPKEGLIGGMIHSTHEKMHSLHEQIWAVEDIPNDSGLLWNMYNRMKQRLAKAKNFILGNGDKPVDAKNTRPPSEEEKVIKEIMDKLFYANGTRRIEENAFDEAVENLRKKLKEMRNEPKTTTYSPADDGEGLIDVRLADVREDLKDNALNAGVDNDIYDKVDDNMNAVNDKGREMINTLKDNVKNVATKEKDVLDTSNQKINQNAKNMGDSVKKSVDDMTRMAYS